MPDGAGPFEVWLVAATPLAFAWHNWEEWRDFAAMKQLSLRRLDIARRDFAYGVTVLSVLTAALCWGGLGFAAADFAAGPLPRALWCALLLNALQHGAVSIVTRRPAPGLRSAVLGMGPLSLAGLMATAPDDYSARSIGMLLLSGAATLAGGVAVGVAAALVSRLVRQKHDPIIHQRRPP
jgi:hypothetical protein